MAKKVMNTDISNKAVVVMLVVVIVVSVVALGIYMNAAESAEPDIIVGDGGQVGLTVDEPVDIPPGEVDSEGGEVGLTIVDS